jgi:RNA polymerase sigma-70 factor (ECF subfamily)
MTAPDPIEGRQAAALLEAARAGDPDAYGTLIGPCQRPLYAYALRLTGDPHLAEDLCQDALLKGFRAIGNFGGNAALATWLYRILHNTWLDHVRRAGRETSYEEAADEAAEEPPVLTREAVTRFQERTRDDDLRERLAAALNELPPAMREVVVLRDVQGHAYDEIAEITGNPVGTIKSRLARAREQLRRLLTVEDAPSAPEAGVKKG